MEFNKIYMECVEGKKGFTEGKEYLIIDEFDNNFFTTVNDFNKEVTVTKAWFEASRFEY